MESKITTIEELRSELKRLKRLQKEQETELTTKLKEWQKLFSFAGKALGYLSPFGDKSQDSILFKDTGLAATSLLILERLFLKDAGLITKLVTGVVFAKLAGSISKDDISSFISKIVDWFKPKDKTKEETASDATPPQ